MLSEGQIEFEKLLDNINSSLLTEDTKKSLRKEARKLAFELSLEHANISAWWQQKYKELMSMETGAAVPSPYSDKRGTAPLSSDMEIDILPPV